MFLVFVFLGGGVLPLNRLPGPLAALAELLPATALTQALQATMTGSGNFPGPPLLILTVWAVIMLVIAIRTFKWE